LHPLRPASLRRRLAWTAVIFAVVAALCGFLDLRAFDYLEQYAYNPRLAIYGARNGSLQERARKQIVLVTLSDDSSTQLPGPPVPRECHAKVVRELTRAGARGDDELANAARSSGLVVWASAFEHEGSPQQHEVLPVTSLQEASCHWGHILVPQDPDVLAVDCIGAAVDCSGRLVPAFSVEIAGMALGLGNEPLRRISNGWRLGDLTIPAGEDGRFNVSYLGKPETVFPRVPYEQVCDGAVDDPFYRQTAFFHDKIVLIGDTTTVGNDHRLTPVGDMFGVEIHANAVATLLQRSFVREARQWLNFATLATMATLACLLAAGCCLRRAVPATACLLAGYLAVNVWLFVDQGLWLHLVAPVSATALATTGVIAQRSLLEEREKNRMRGLRACPIRS
jgi:adenylate cyclase